MKRIMSNPKVELHIADYGVITLELDEDKAPKSVANFLAYVKKGHYDNTVFHRVIPGFMVQGGGFEPGMKQKPTRRADRERGQQRPEERQLHRGHGAHQRPALGHRAVLHQRRRQRLPEPHRAQRAGLGLCGVRQGGRRHRRGRQDQGREDRPQGLPRRRAERGRGDREGRGRRDASCRPQPWPRPCRRRSRSCRRPPAGARSTSSPTCTCRPASRAPSTPGAATCGRRRPTRCSSSATCSRSGSATTRRCSRASRPTARRCCAPLRARAPVFFMHGNRDFLVGAGIAAASGVTLLDDPTVLAFAGAALAAHARRCAVPGRHRLPAVSRPGAQRRAGSRPSWPSRWPSARRSRAACASKSEARKAAGGRATPTSTPAAAALAATRPARRR